MRPPQNAGENGARARSRSTLFDCFNEAPAECGGKQRTPCSTRVRGRCFNEAPAECGGKHWRQGQLFFSGKRFNEAPAECGGKP